MFSLASTLEVTSSSPVWIGLMNSNQKTGSWGGVWIDHSIVDYTNWCPGMLVANRTNKKVQRLSDKRKYRRQLRHHEREHKQLLEEYKL